MNCSRCGYFFSNISGAFTCPTCGNLLSDNSHRETITGNYIPWEAANASSYPFSALVETLQQTLFRPDRFFAKISRTRQSALSAWLYGLITGSFGLTAALIWSLLLHNILSDSTELFRSGRFSPDALIWAPLIISVQLLMTAGYVQLMLLITHSRKLPFNSTFRAVCFAQSAVILNAIPVAGTVIAPLVWIYLLLTAVHRLHQMSRFRAFLILILPMFFLSVLASILLVAALIGGLAATGYLKELLFFLR